tara:strand:- start:4362 stop:5276 length:915 start_codon:yes stop_codon:yes gene_type:complete
MVKTFYSNGKLLLTGEYVVLDGALSLAIPTKFGQSLVVESILEPKLIWKSLNEKGSVWFEDEFFMGQQVISKTSNNDLSDRLLQILKAAKKLNPLFLTTNSGYKLTSQLDFPKNWGLGTSSTLINNIAQWAKVDAFKLLDMTFGGSGYDIACAQHNYPISYQIQNKTPVVKKTVFNPPFKEHLYFVYLNKKQNSSDGIAHYKSNKENKYSVIQDISDITNKIITCETLVGFEKLITTHEQIISKVIKQKPVKELLFNDFQGSMKSLGAWGGDFILVATPTNPAHYFQSKGYDIVIPFKDMILSK